MFNLLFVKDGNVLTKPGVVRTIYDPAAGTRGMLPVAGEHFAGLNPKATWRSCYASNCKSAYPGSIPGVASILFL
jgi:type I restriction-modification system DNA methylase subunit